MNVAFGLHGVRGSGAPVCTGFADQPTACGSCDGNAGVIVYTAEGGQNTLDVQAKLSPATVPLFVIGDVEPHAIGNSVNFWGAQWWKNNFMSGFVSHGVASFKGYANKADDFCGGEWQTRPGNSSGPPPTIPNPAAIIVTDTVVKQGPNIGGNIKEILLVSRYGPKPGHRSTGIVPTIVSTMR
jgi:hypothetical protein